MPRPLLFAACLLAGCLEGGSDLTARPYDEDATCWGEAETVGSTSAEGCDGALTLATSPDGDCWLFPSSCLPDAEGWVADCPLSFAEVDDPTCGDT